MGLAINYRNEIINISKELSNDKLKELIDFAHFLKVKAEGFNYKTVRDSTEYVKKMRKKEGERTKSGKKFIEEIIEWQKSNY